MPISKTRIEALSDGVVAVVLTLLVIDLKPEGLRSHPDNLELWGAVRHVWFHFLGYMITFALTCAFWYQHHAWLHVVTRLNRASFWINAGFLFAVTLLPFSVSVFLKNPAAPTAFLCYFGNLGLMGAMLAIGWRHARSAGFISSNADPETVMGFERLSRAFAIAALLAAAVAFLAPVLAGPAYALPFFLLRRKSRKVPEPVAATSA